MPDDLRRTDRLLELHQQATAGGLAASGDHGRLRFMSLAEHALTYATKNPCGLFAWLLRNPTSATAFITQSDEDEASRRLKDHLYGGTWAVDVPLAKPVERQPVLAPLSELGRLAAAVQRTCVGRGIEDLFIVARGARPSLTREQWGRALEEIEEHRFRSVTARTLQGVHRT